MRNGQQYSEATKVFKKVIWTRLFLRCVVAHLLYYYYIIYLESEQTRRINRSYIYMDYAHLEQKCLSVNFSNVTNLTVFVLLGVEAAKWTAFLSNSVLTHTTICRVLRIIMLLIQYLHIYVCAKVSW